MSTYYLVLTEFGSDVLLASCTLNDTEREEMISEVEAYNQHIANLETGLAPESSYEDSETRIRYFNLAKGRSATWREHHRIELTLQLCDENYECVTGEGRGFDAHTVLEVPVNCEEFFNRPFAMGESPSLGYGMLPTTRVMLGRSYSK